MCSAHQYALYEELTEETLRQLECLLLQWIVVDEDGCWIWTGNVSGGYSTVKINGRWISVHRWMYMHLVGVIPNRHEMHHECEKTRCVRPGHLRPLTPEKHREITAFRNWMFSIMPSAALAIDNVSRSEAERLFAALYGLPHDGVAAAVTDELVCA